MERLSPRMRFLVINLDEIIILLLILAGIYWIFPDYFQVLAVIAVVGFIILIAAKYRLLYPVLNDVPRNYDVTDMIGETISHVTADDGRIRIGAEIWHARTEGDEIPAGTRVRVVSRNGMVLLVAREDTD